MNMKTNNLISNMMLSSINPEPEVGMGATVCWYSDRSACTIVGVRRFKTGKRKGQVSSVLVQSDKAFRTDDNGMSDAQSYRFECDPHARISEFKVKADGSFGNLSIGHRSHYHDFSF